MTDKRGRTAEPASSMGWIYGATFVTDLVRELDEKRRMWLYGGAGFGKTELLLRLSETLRQAGGLIFLLDGSKMHERVELLKDYFAALIAGGDQTVYLLVDAAEETLAGDEVAKILENLTATPTPAREAILVCTRRSPTELSAQLDINSLFWRSLHSRMLDPWIGDWQERLKSRVDDLLIDPKEARDPKGRSAAQQQLVSLWTQILVDLTGGHPLLLGTALERLGELVALGRKPKAGMAELDLLSLPRGGQKEQESLKHDIERCVLDHLESTRVPWIRRAVEQLRKDNLPAFEALSALAEAHRAGRRGDIEDSKTRVALMAAGLVRKDHAQRGTPLVIPGRLMLETVRQARAASSKVGLVGEPGARGGRLIVGEHSVDVAGSSWQLLTALMQAGKAVSIEALGEELDLTVPAVRSAMQRLVAMLDREGLGGVVENVRNVGYRLAPNPPLSR